MADIKTESDVMILNFQKEVRNHDIKFYVTFKHLPGDDEPTEGFFNCILKWEQKTFHETKDYKSKTTCGWQMGYDMAETNADGSITFGEYFSKTPAVEGLIAEIEQMYFDKTHSVSTTRSWYLRRLLISLANFWD